MKILFFIVHPSKYYLFRHIINNLISKGYDVEIVIVTKDVLEELIINEGWKYTNIFPKGRRSDNFRKFMLYFNAFVTVWRLFKHTLFKKYDLFITDDLLVVIGKIKSVPTWIFVDDDIAAVPEIEPFLKLATNVLSPIPVDLDKYNKKKIEFNGYKELASLHPNIFIPDDKVIEKYNLNKFEPYFLVRLVALTASHDDGINGINDTRLNQLIELLSKYGRVVISSERPLKVEFEKYRLKMNPNDMPHILAFANMYIGDSQTMTSEATILGTPAIRFNDFVGRITVMDEKEHKYGLTYGFKSNQFDEMLLKIEELLKIPTLKEEWLQRRDKMIEGMVDLNKFVIERIENIKK